MVGIVVDKISKICALHSSRRTYTITSYLFIIYIYWEVIIFTGKTLWLPLALFVRTYCDFPCGFHFSKFSWVCHEHIDSLHVTVGFPFHSGDMCVCVKIGLYNLLDPTMASPGSRSMYCMDNWNISKWGRAVNGEVLPFCGEGEGSADPTHICASKRDKISPGKQSPHQFLYPTLGVQGPPLKIHWTCCSMIQQVGGRCEKRQICRGWKGKHHSHGPLQCTDLSVDLDSAVQ